MIDFHAHLDLYPDPQEIARECKIKDIYVLSVTTTPSAWVGTSALAIPGSRINTALGLHPQVAHQRKGELEAFDRYLPDTRYIGEIGLDGTPEFKNYWADQLEVFSHILKACSCAGGRIISAHSRRATSAVLDYLEKFPDAGLTVLHWFTGSKRDLERALSLGCWFSIGPAMLVSERSREMVKHIPTERVLTETDGPFAQVEKRSALPWDAQKATIQLARLWEVENKDAELILENNLQKIISTL